MFVTFAAGVGVAAITIFSIVLMRQHEKVWAFPMTLASYPLFYLGFAGWAGDWSALQQELLWALPFWALVLVMSIWEWRWAVVTLGLGYIGHGVFDLYHAQLISNPGLPSWWPLFCAVVDTLIGLFLLVMSEPWGSYRLEPIRLTTDSGKKK